MQIIDRSVLLATLIGQAFDPEQAYTEEMTAFANAILADAPESATHFVYTDNENGDDPTVSWGQDADLHCVVSQELIPLTYTKSGDSYYGLSASHSSYEPERSRVIYYCYLGGSPLNSAPGFVLTTARMFG